MHLGDRTPGEAAQTLGHAGLTDRLGGGVALGIGLALVAVTCAYRLAIFKVPVIDGDEYAFALVGRDVLHGMAPNAGVFDNKPVGLTYLFALAQMLCGQTVFALRALGLTASVISGALLYGAGRTLGLRSAGALVIAALVMLGCLCTGGVSTMSELLAAPLLAAANGLLAGGRRSPLTLLGLGAAFGLACQLTYLAAPCAVLTVVGRLLIDRRGSWGRRLGDCGLIILGGAAAVVAVWTPQVMAGGWSAYMAEQLHYHRGYRLASFRWGAWATGFVTPLVGLALPIIVLLPMRARQGPAAGALPPLFWIMGLQALGAILAATASNRFYAHYLILAVPAVAMMTALLLAQAPPSKRHGGWLGLSVILAIAAALPFDLIRDRLKTPGVEARAAEVVDRLTRPGQAIVVFDEAPAIYYLAQRPAVGRYIFPSHYLFSCDHAPPIRAPAAVLGEALARRPALVLVGALCPPMIDAETRVRQAGYRRLYAFQADHRPIAFYAPIVPAPSK